MNSSRPNVMIISTPMPNKNHIGYTPGQSSLILQKITSGGLVSIRPNKKLRGEEKQIFLSHLKKNGWLIITGSGVAGTDRLGKINGKSEINCTAKDYVELVMQAKVLSDEDSLHIVLYASYGALETEANVSFATQLAEEFAKQHIFTKIFATTGLTGRIDETFDFYDIEDQQVRFRTNRKDLCILYGGPNQEIEVVKPKQNFYITKNSFGFSCNFIECTKRFLMNKLLKIPEKNKDEIIKLICDFLFSPSDNFFQSHSLPLTESLMSLPPKQILRISQLLEKISKKYLAGFFLNKAAPAQILHKEILNEKIGSISDYLTKKILKKRIENISKRINKIYHDKRKKIIIDFVWYKRELEPIINSARFTGNQDVRLEKCKRVEKIEKRIEKIKKNLDNYSSIEDIKRKLKDSLNALLDIDNKYPPFKFFFSKTLEQKLLPFMPASKTVLVIK